MKMSEAAKEARRAYLREWRRKNAEKVKESQTKYWERKAAEMHMAKEDGNESD